MLVLVTCAVILIVCILVFFIIFKIAFKIKNTKIKFASMIISALYVLSPIDFIPDFIPVLGQTDDAGALAAFAGLAFSIYSDFRKKSKQKNNEE